MGDESEHDVRVRCNRAMGWDRWQGPAGPAGPAPVGPIPDGLTGEDEIAWISDRLIGCNPELSSPVWAYREKLAALRAIRALSKLPTGAEPPRDTPPDVAEQRRVNDEQVKARNRRAFQRSEKMVETVRQQQYEKRHGQGYSRPDGSWVSMRDEPSPGMRGAPPDAQKPSPTTAVADPPPEPRGKISGELAALIILVIGVCYAIAAPSAQLWGRIVALAVAVVLGVVLAIWADIPRVHVPRLARVLASIVWVVLGFVESYSIFQSANPSVARYPVMNHRPVYVDYANIDGSGRRIYVRARIDNTTNDELTYSYYGKAILGPTAKTPEAAYRIAEPLGDEVRRIASGGGALPLPLSPMAENVPVFIKGPHATPKQWRDFLDGKARLYFYAVIYPKLGDGTRFTLVSCGTSRARNTIKTDYGCPHEKPGEI